MQIRKVLASKTAFFLHWAAVIFCFFVFPAFIISLSYENLLQIRTENHKFEIYQQLSQNLEPIRFISTQKKYFSRVFQHIFKTALEQKDPIVYLEKSMQLLKNNYPNQLEFIVWDENGDIVEDLTDEKRYRFVIRRLYQVLLEVATHISTTNSFELGDLRLLNDNKNLIGQFLGRIFIEANLAVPYYPEHLSSLILADFGEERPYFWYHADQSLGFLCFVSSAAVSGNEGLKKIINNHNIHSRHNKIGFASINNRAQIYTGEKIDSSYEIIRALEMFEQGANNNIETAKYFINIQMPGDGIFLFSCRLKEQEKFNLEFKRNAFVVRFSSLYFIIAMIVIMRLHQSFFSIRHKVLLLFLYVIIAPLLVLGGISNQYIHTLRLQLRNQFQLESTRLINDFDQRIDEFKSQLANKVNQIIEELSSSYGSADLDQADIDKIYSALVAFRPSEVHIVNYDGESLLAVDAFGNYTRRSTTFVRSLATAVLPFMSGVIVEHGRGDLLERMVAPERSVFLRQIFQFLGKVMHISVGDTVRLSYGNVIGERENYDYRHFVLIFWDEEELEKMFLERYFHQIDLSDEDFFLAASTLKADEFFPRSVKDDNLKRFLSKILHGTTGYFRRILIDEQWHVAYGQRGNNMTHTNIAAFMPLQAIEDRVIYVRNTILLGALLSIVMTIIIAMTVAAQFADPIKKLEISAIAIKEKDYRRKIDIKDQDEFGHLARVLNPAIESLKELEIAYIVQESLLPQPTFSSGGFEVFGKSVAMTTLGGDYIDYLEVDNDCFGLIIGDVAGHGVSAGLVMAMAKSAVQLAQPEELKAPAKLLKSLHPVIRSVKTSQIRPMMTFAYLLVNKKTADITFSNAGHCYPLIVNGEKGECRYVELTGTPLGMLKSPKYKSAQFSLCDDEALILYTDGIVEAVNEKDEMLGSEGLKQMALAAFDNDPKIFYQNLFSKCISYSKTVEDDITIVVIKKKRVAD